MKATFRDSSSMRYSVRPPPTASVPPVAQGPARPSHIRVRAAPAIEEVIVANLARDPRHDDDD